MKFLLDTNVVSEFAKEQVNPGVSEWLAQGDERTMAISVVTIGEIEKGIAWMPDGIGTALRAGAPLPQMDTLIAAVAINRDLTLVTRNTEDFKRTGVTLLNPWR